MGKGPSHPSQLMVSGFSGPCGVVAGDSGELGACLSPLL